jgi:hypothetical protein
MVKLLEWHELKPGSTINLFSDDKLVATLSHPVGGAPVLSHFNAPVRWVLPPLKEERPHKYTISKGAHGLIRANYYNEAHIWPAKGHEELIRLLSRDSKKRSKKLAFVDYTGDFPVIYTIDEGAKLRATQESPERKVHTTREYWDTHR